ncbi:MAG TPA: AAA family ATPase [Terriglobales bacterium]|jgi:pilus assembly protein CpaE
MPELSVAVIAGDADQRTMLQVLVEGTHSARIGLMSSSFPMTAADPSFQKLQTIQPDVVLIDIPSDGGNTALRSIELLHQEMPEAVVIAIGNLSQPQMIVNSMRAGAREFLERPVTTSNLLEAFVRLSTKKRKVTREERRGKVFTVVNAKGGSGATTIAVNLALALQAAHGHTALVDLAPLGHTSLHMNLKPLFTVADAIRNLHRLDHSLLEGYMTRHSNGLQVLAGPANPVPIEPSTSEFARLFDMLVGHYRYVVVDASTRIDAATRVVCNLSETVMLVAHSDVASLWSAARVHEFLSETGSRDRVQLVLNRFRKIAGFSDLDAEAAAGSKLLWKVPNHYFAVSSAIDRGVPLMHQSHTEIARCFIDLATRLTENDRDVKREAWSLFKTV